MAASDLAVPALRVQTRLLRGRTAVVFVPGRRQGIIAARVSVQTSAEQPLDTSSLAAAVRLVGLRKSYGEVVAVDGVDLEIPAGEFFTMLGPSGSGKTTTLRLIAGFEQPDDGRVELDGKDVTTQPPYARDVNTVFQDYALFPHMSIAENVAYGLRVKGVGKAERQAARRRDARADAAPGRRRPQADPALGRPAPAGRARARARQPARRCCCWTSPSARST